MIVVFPEAVNVTSIQDDITLTCNASGFPIPQISWTHNMTEVRDGDDRVSIMEELGSRTLMSTLIVTTAMTNDSGQYECIATSLVSTFSKVRSGPVTVLVQGEFTAAIHCAISIHYLSNFGCIPSNS